MHWEEMKSVRAALDVFIAQFDDCIKTSPSRRHLRTYVGGQVRSLERKSVEPIALELLEYSMAGGMRFASLTADEAYGQVSAFRKGVGELGLSYVVEVPCKTSGWAECPPLEKADAKPWRGRPRTWERLAASARKARRVDRLWPRGGPAWQAYHVKDTEKGPVVWEARAVRFLP